MDGPFQPTWHRALAAIVVAAAAFLWPQEAALEWYPLNDPSPGTLQIEISCHATVAVNMQLLHASGRGPTPIAFPISPTSSSYTYHFPLPDAPLTELGVDPAFTGPGEFIVTSLRLIERHGTEIRSFPIESVIAGPGMTVLPAKPSGWKIVAVVGAPDPIVSLKLPAPVIPAGMNARNLQRCLLSTGYLAGMLWLILAIVYFIVDRETPWRRMARPLLFLGLLGLLFGIVGNRGLIHASVRSAQVASAAERR